MVTPRRWRCPGKMFWLGEYAVLDGAPAIVARGTTLREAFVARNEAGVLATDVPPGAELVAAVVAELGERGRLGATGVDVTADSSALSISGGGRKLGLGSSGAVAAGLTLALGDWAPEGGAPAAAAQVAATAVAAHRRFQHGRGSGADVVASLYGGLTRQAAGVEARRVACPPGLRFVAIDTGESASTTALVAAVRAARDRDPRGGDEQLGALARIATEGAAALEAGDVDAWLAAVAAYCDAERALARWSGAPIFTPSVERAIAAASDAGWVAKPSGAGGGDVVVAFARTRTAPDRIREACATAGVRLLPLALCDDGANTPAA